MSDSRAAETLVFDRNNNDAFSEHVHKLIDMKLKSLTTHCPVCGRDGLALTKWIKGQTIKPLYIFHGNGNGVTNGCCPPEKIDREIRRKVELSATDFRKLLRNTHAYILLSGGMDSLCTILYMLHVLKDDGNNITAIHIDTTAGFPEVTEYVKEICEILSVPLKIVSPKRDYFELAKKWGIPNHNARWCCKELKVKPVEEFLSQVDGSKIIIDGIRSAESILRRTYLPVWYHPTFRCLSVSPILGWPNEEVRRYVEASGLPEGPAKEMGCSAECWCGAYKARPDFEKLLEVHPDIFDKLVDVEEAQEGRYTFLFENGKQVALKSLIKKN
ncbi:phosphoadenosine phosphosulfate reductase family protein [Candidatus Neomarinimicrobiota bacterium]